MIVDGGKRLQDEHTLSSYNGITDGSVVLLVVLLPFEIYVKGADGRIHTITVKSSEPDVCACIAVYYYALHPFLNLLRIDLPLPNYNSLSVCNFSRAILCPV